MLFFFVVNILCYASFLHNCTIQIMPTTGSIQFLLRFICQRSKEYGEQQAISIHLMLHFIHRKHEILSHKTPIFYHINQHFSTLFSSFFIFFHLFSTQHFIIKNHHIYQSISYISYLSPVGKKSIQFIQSF